MNADWIDKNSPIDFDILTKWEKEALEVLPHGSGINTDYWVTKGNRSKKLVVTNSFECLNDKGMYDGYCQFTIRIKPWKLHDFKLEFNGQYSRNKARTYGLRPYLEDLFALCFEQLKNKRKEAEKLKNRLRHK